jgi:long-chain acyl-CoA synthetase
MANMESISSAEAINQHRQVVAQLTAPGAPFEVVPADVKGRQAKVFRHAPRSVIDLFATAERQFAHRTFVVDGEDCYSFGQVFDAARRLAGALRDRYAIGPGDRVGIVMRNRPEYFVALIAVAQAGAIGALLNSRGSADELAAAEADLDCPLVLADGPRAALLRDGGADVPMIVVTRGEQPSNVSDTDDYDLVLAQSEPLTNPVHVDEDDPVWVLFTSGTSGRPKGATLTHRNICNMAMTINFAGAGAVQQMANQLGCSADEILRSAPAPANLQIFPLFHISGLISTIGALQSGGKLILIRRWNVAQAAKLISQHQVMTLAAPPMVLIDLLDLSHAAKTLSGVKTFVMGGQAIPGNLKQRIAQGLPAASMATGWGMTEACGTVSTLGGALYALHPDSAGLAGPLMEIRTVDERGSQLPPDVPGELQVRGALVMKGYWNRPQETADSFDGEWYRTGDVGYLDKDGFVFVVDRKKDMVISAGENIYCAEVERVLSACPDILEVAVFGVPDPRLGERAIAAVRLRDGASLDQDGVRQLARLRLADYKVPAAVLFSADPFPRNVTGKLDKKKLSSLYLDARDGTPR